MAGWAAAHAERPPARSPRPRPVRRTKPQRRVTGGVLWIGVLAILLAGVVAMNVAVLRLNMTLDRLGRERAALRTANSNLNSRISSNAAAPRIQAMAAKRLGWVEATPDQTIYDRSGVQLALGEQATTVYANPRQVVNPRAAAEAAARALGIDEESLAARLADRSHGFVYVARQED